MAMANALPDASHFLDLIHAFRKSKVLFATVEIGIPDMLREKGSCTVLELADLVTAKQTEPKQASVDGLDRLLSACVGLGIVRSDGEKYSLTREAETYLTTTSPYSLTGYIIHSNRLLYNLWSGLDKSVVTGEPCWKDVFNLDSGQVWSNTYKTQEDMLRFLKGMHSFASLSSDAICKSFDLSAYHKLVDLGGATGALAFAACGVYPQLQAVVVDLPNVVELSQTHFKPTYCTLDASTAARVEWLPADFFKQQHLIPKADLFVLSRILHDWDVTTCRTLLELVYDRLLPGGALLVCEMLLDESRAGPTNALLQSLNMLVGWHGRERTLSEYRELLQSCGFSCVQGSKTGSYLDAIIAHKEATPNKQN